MKQNNKNVTKTDQKQKQDALHKIRMLIDLAALVPPTVKIPELSSSDLSRVYDEWNVAVDYDVYAFPVSNEIWNKIYEKIKNYPKLLKFLENSIREERKCENKKTATFKIVDRNPEPFDLDSMLLVEKYYYDFYLTLGKFKFVAYGLHLKRGFFLNDHDYITSRPILFPIFSLQENGIFLIPDSKIECLFGINLERLRICHHCQKIFWADRIDSWGCSPAHNLILRQKKFRKTSRVKTKVDQKKIDNWLDREKRQEKLNQNYSK